MKKTLTLFIAILVTTIGFAQADLHVGTGSYIYVDGTAFASGPTVAPLYVTGDINLVDDIAVQDNGNIYLRNGAQLLQGNTGSNSGDGQLSVYQTGTSNTYMYNYWSSPVGLNTGVAGNTNFRANNALYGETAAPITSLPATYVSAPNYDGVAGTPPVIAEFWFYSFIGTSAAPNEYQDWVAVGSAGTLAPGYGFTMKGNPSGGQQYDFRGRPNNGLITVPINANRESLVGNPYPSAIDARAFIHGNTNNAAIINVATLSFWEQDPTGSTSHVLTNYNGGYATYTINASGPVVDLYTPATFDTYNADGTFNSTGSGSTGKNIYRYIPIGQGFTVESDGTAGSIQFTNTMRVFQKEGAGFSEFYRLADSEESIPNEEASYDENGLSIMPEGYKRFRLNLDFNETYTRQLAQTFHHTATPGEDYGLETKSPAALESDAYWPQGEKAFNGQAFAFDVDLRIPMVINIDADQLLRFRIFDVQNFNEQDIYIHDIDTGEYINLREDNYEINLTEGTYTDRFEITFQRETLSIEEISASDFDVFQNIKYEELTVLNPNGWDVKSVELYDVTGKRVFNATNLGNQLDYRFSTKTLSEGVYVATISVDGKQDLSKKIIIKN